MAASHPVDFGSSAITIADATDFLAPGSAGMACVSCGHPNPAGAKFCNECGAPTHVPVCPACKSENRREAVVCRVCGASLVVQPDDDAIVTSIADVPLPSTNGDPAEGDLFDWPPTTVTRSEGQAGSPQAFLEMASRTPAPAAAVDATPLLQAALVAQPANADLPLQHTAERKGLPFGRAGAVALLVVASAIVGYLGSRALLPSGPSEGTTSTGGTDRVARGAVTSPTPQDAGASGGRGAAMRADLPPPAGDSPRTEPRAPVPLPPTTVTTPADARGEAAPKPAELPSADAAEREGSGAKATAAAGRATALPAPGGAAVAPGTARVAASRAANARSGPAGAAASTRAPSAGLAARATDRPVSPSTTVNNDSPKSCTEALEALGLCTSAPTR